MGYVKMKKAAGNIDILSAEGVGSIKLAGSGTPEPIIVTYVAAGASAADKQLIVTITPDGSTSAEDFIQADVDALNIAVGTIGGGSGMIGVDLSQTISSVAVGESS